MSMTIFSGFLNAAPYVMLPVPPEGEEIPDSRPNKGSVRKRNHQKRMAQRMEFAKVCLQFRRGIVRHYTFHFFRIVFHLLLIYHL